MLIALIIIITKAIPVATKLIVKLIVFKIAIG